MWRTILSPAVQLMKRFTFLHKFILISFLFILPLAVLSWGLISETNRQIDSTRSEQLGLAIISEVYPLLDAAITYRDLAILERIESSQQLRNKIIKAREQVKQAMQRLMKNEVTHSTTLEADFQQATDMLNNQWQRLNEQHAGGQGDVALQFDYYDNFINAIDEYLNKIIHASKLIHDPELYTFLIIHTLSKELPKSLSLIGQLRSMGSYSLYMGNIDSHTFDLLGDLHQQIIAEQQHWQNNFEFGLGKSPLLEQPLRAASHEYIVLLGQAEEYFYQSLIEPVNLDTPAMVYFDGQSKVLSQGIEYAGPLIAVIEQQLEGRILNARSKLRWLLLSSFLLFSLISYLASGIYYSLSRTIENFTDKAENVAKGDLSVTMNINTEDEMAELGKAFNQMTSELRLKNKRLLETDKMATLGGLLAGLSHEMNTPLGVAITAGTLLADAVKDFDEKYKNNQLRQRDVSQLLKITSQSLSLVTASLDKLNNLVNLFTMLSVDEQNIIFRPFSMAPILAGLPQRAANEDINLEGICFNWRCDDDVKLTSEPELLQTALLILIKNTVCHAFNQPEQQQKSLTVIATAEAKEVVIRLIDNGCGIASVQQAHIFDPFYTTQRNRGAIGLGLHILYNLVTQTLHGEISCKSQSGEGTEFMIRLPRGNGSQTDSAN